MMSVASVSKQYSLMVATAGRETGKYAMYQSHHIHSFAASAGNPPNNLSS